MKKLFIIALLLSMVSAVNAQKAATKKHKFELHVSMGVLTSGKMTTAWPKPYDKWNVFPSRLHSAGLGYKVGKHLVTGVDVRAGFMLADNKMGAKIYNSTETAWMMLSAGLFADYRICIGNGSVYIGMSGYKSGSYDHPSKQRSRVVIGEGWVYGPRLGFSLPISKSVSFYGQAEHITISSRGFWFNNPLETKISGVPVVAGVKFRL